LTLGVFFNAKIPKYMNYGAVGIVIGHEITHGFDDRGKQRNGKG
jgi:putative endopeptidase